MPWITVAVPYPGSLTLLHLFQWNSKLLPPPISEGERIGANVRKLLFDLCAHQLQVINPPAVGAKTGSQKHMDFPIRKYKPNSDYLLFRFILWVM